MTRHLPVLIVAVPLLGAMVAPLVGLASVGASRAVSLVALLLAHLSALGALRVALAGGAWRYELGGWAPPWGIEYVVDPLAGGMAVLVSFMALLTAVHSAGDRRQGALETPSGIALHLLMTAGLLGIVVSGDAFNLYVFLEVAAISAYALLAAGGDRAAVAAFRYLLLGTIAASFYLLGVGYLYAVTGTLNLADLAARLPEAGGGPAVATALALIVVGLAMKAAVFPLHGWLPDAYAYAPPAMAAFSSAVMGKVGAYVLLRILLGVFEARGAAAGALDLLGLAGAAAIVAGSAMALAQRDLRRMLAWSSVGQMGFVVMGLGLGNAAALVGALLHAVNHAVLKACLFLAAGNVFAGEGAAAVADYAGMARRAPLTMAAFAVAALSMIGLPPTGGFFSKWHLVLGALEGGAWAYVAAILASSLLTAVYVFRVLEGAYFREPAAGRVRQTLAASNGPVGGGGEAAPAMLVPVVTLAVAVLALGLFNQALVEGVLRPAVAGMGR